MFFLLAFMQVVNLMVSELKNALFCGAFLSVWHLSHGVPTDVPLDLIVGTCGEDVLLPCKASRNPEVAYSAVWYKVRICYHLFCFHFPHIYILLNASMGVINLQPNPNLGRIRQANWPVRRQQFNAGQADSPLPSSKQQAAR